MLLRKFLTGCVVLTLGVYFCPVEAKLIPQDVVSAAYESFKSDYESPKVHTIPEQKGPTPSTAVAFLDAFSELFDPRGNDGSGGYYPDDIADTKYMILRTGYGVGGISTNPATDVDRPIMCKALKSLTFRRTLLEIPQPASSQPHENQHRLAIDSLKQTFSEMRALPVYYPITERPTLPCRALVIDICKSLGEAVSTQEGIESLKLKIYCTTSMIEESDNIKTRDEAGLILKTAAHLYDLLLASDLTLPMVDAGRRKILDEIAFYDQQELVAGLGLIDTSVRFSDGVTDVFLDSFIKRAGTKLKNCKDLSLDVTSVSNGALERLIKALPKLTRLRLQNVNMSHNLNKFTSITNITLCGDAFNHDIIKQLPPHVTDLSLYGKNLAGVETLTLIPQYLKRLASLNLGGPLIEPDLIERARRQGISINFMMWVVEDAGFFR